jgi:hypothetical protein
MSKKLSLLGVMLLAFTFMAWAAPQAEKAAKSEPAGKTYYVTVSDSNCGLKHATPSAEAAACVAKCVQGGAKYVAVYRGKVYQLEPQDKLADFAGKRAKIIGTRSGDTITVASVEPLKSRSAGRSKKATTAPAKPSGT